MSAEDLCNKCQHPRSVHGDTTGEPTKCSGGACACGGFEEQV